MDTHNDGGVAFGSQVVAITSVDFIAEAFTLTRGSNQSVRNDEEGVPNGQHFRKTVASGSLTLQLSSATVKAPALFSTFSATPIGGAADGSEDVTLIITEVGETTGNEAEKKVSVNVAEQISA